MYPPRLPDPPAPDPTDTAVLYGCRVLYFLLSTSVYCTASREQLEAAQHASQTAVTAPGILPIAVDRLSAVRHAIAAQLRLLDRLAGESAQTGQPARCTPGSSDGPGQGGSREPLRPRPRTEPPAGAYAELNF